MGCSADCLAFDFFFMSNRIFGDFQMNIGMTLNLPFGCRKKDSFKKIETNTPSRP